MCDLVRISVLGPLRVTAAGQPVALPAKQRTLLAILAFQANRVVRQDRLIEAGWGEDASVGLSKTLQSHVFQLRRALGAAADGTDGEPRIATEPGGYRLDVDPAAIDALVFVRLAAEAQRDKADLRASARLHEQALALWRGPGVADVGDEPVAMTEIQQLEWLRLGLVEGLARLRLALGEHEQLVPDLRRALSEAPYNEQLWATLMTALARSGKRAEALMAYQQARAALRAELDIEPGHDLQALALRLRDGGSVPDAGAAGRGDEGATAPAAPGDLEAAIQSC